MTPEREMFDAIKAGDAARLREIVGARRDLVSAKDPSGLSPLMLSCYAGLDDGVQALLAAGARLDVFEAAAVGDAARLAQQVDADPKLVHALSPDGFPPLNLAAYFGHAKAVDYLLEKGADPNAVSKNALRLRPIHGAAAHKIDDDREEAPGARRRRQRQAGGRLDAAPPGRIQRQRGVGPGSDRPGSQDRRPER
jgi:uncharacterized protein